MNSTFCPCTVNPCDVTVYALKNLNKKKKKKGRKHKREFEKADPNPHIVGKFINLKSHECGSVSL